MFWCSLSPLFYCVYEDFLTEEVKSIGKQRWMQWKTGSRNARGNTCNRANILHISYLQYEIEKCS